MCVYETMSKCTVQHNTRVQDLIGLDQQQHQSVRCAFDVLVCCAMCDLVCDSRSHINNVLNARNISGLLLFFPFIIYGFSTFNLRPFLVKTNWFFVV